MIPESIELDIKELVLYGFLSADCYRIGDAFERELTRLFVERGMPASLSAPGVLAHLDGRTLQVAMGDSPDDTGARIAQAVYGGFCG